MSGFPKLIHSECAAAMSTLPEGCVDLTVTSPPYDDMRTYGGFVFYFEPIANQLFRVTKDGGVVVWVVGDATKNGNETGTSFKQALYFKSIGFNLHDTMIYEKAQACFGSNKAYLQSFEYMFVFSKGKPKSINLIRDRENVRPETAKIAKHAITVDGQKAERTVFTTQELGRRKNIWKFGVGGGKSDHPAVFPLELARDHILSWSNEGDTVCDPFSGSGTTGHAAVAAGRQFIGMEMNAEYFQYAQQRITRAWMEANGYGALAK